MALGKPASFAMQNYLNTRPNRTTFTMQGVESEGYGYSLHCLKFLAPASIFRVENKEKAWVRVQQ